MLVLRGTWVYCLVVLLVLHFLPPVARVPDGPLPPLGGVFTGVNTEAKGTHVALSDGSVWFLRPGVSEATLRAAITRNDGKAPGPDW